MPLISVIIPTYNREKFIGKAIDSVLRQGFPDLEIIVIDDGSTDGTRKVLEAYGDTVRCIYQENSGVSSARNSGIRSARGMWLAFLDSDDEWMPDYLSAQIQYCEEYSEAVAHITNAVTIGLDGRRSSLFVETGLITKFKANPSLIFERPLSAIVKHAPWFLQSAIMRKDMVLTAGLLDEELSIAEDFDLVARVALRGPFTFCNRELVEVHRRQESMESLSRQSLKRGIYRYSSFRKVYVNLLQAPGLTASERAGLLSALSCTQRALGNMLVMADRKLEARQMYKDSLFASLSLRSLIKYVVTFLPGDVSRVLVRRGRPDH